MKTVLSFFVCLSTILMVNGSPHVHQRSKERIEDGFGGSQHYRDGEHNVEYDHEAVLGSKDTAKQFHTLTDDEAKRRLSALVVNSMDVNKDSYVDKEELTQWIMKSFVSLAVEDGKERLEEEDTDGDGFVSWSEHLADSFDAEDINDNNLLHDEVMAEDNALWRAADRDGDGKLSPTEFAEFYSPEEFERMHDTLYDQMMIKRDKDKDGFIDFREFISDSYGSVPDASSEQYISEKDRFINDYDLNKDGKLNKTECLLWLIPDNREIAESEANHLISTSDDNNDGKLSVNEIVEHHNIFVGSEATDFGQQLENTRLIDEL